MDRITTLQCSHFTLRKQQGHYFHFHLCLKFSLAFPRIKPSFPGKPFLQSYFRFAAHTPLNFKLWLQTFFPLIKPTGNGFNSIISHIFLSYAQLQIIHFFSNGFNRNTACLPCLRTLLMDSFSHLEDLFLAADVLSQGLYFTLQPGLKSVVWKLQHYSHICTKYSRYFVYGTFADLCST